MKSTRQQAKADCIVEFQILNPKTNDQEWKVYESMTIHAPTIDHLIERAHMYIGRPERHKNVSAIRLKGTMTIIDQEKDEYRDHEDTVKVDLNILRERTIPIPTQVVAIGQ
jgi:uncharacterized Zn finger protein